MFKYLAFFCIIAIALAAPAPAPAPAGIIAPGISLAAPALTLSSPIIRAPVLSTRIAAAPLAINSGLLL